MAREAIRSWLTDMDGVLVHEEQAIPGADVDRFPYRPSRVVDSVAALTELIA